jgi:hypothetical protein
MDITYLLTFVSVARASRRRRSHRRFRFWLAEPRRPTAPPPNEADGAGGAVQREPRGSGCEQRRRCRSKLALPIGGTGRAQYIMASAGED